ncbi:MAG TPA: hypothetical protein VHF47_11275 [Acidimicrobiales bacterium]|nr:hypothetical protein [Acidimicrobiales bacterium]
MLRRLLDEPAGVADVDREHVASCEECLRGLAAVREDADIVHAALATDAGPDDDAAVAWQRLSAVAAVAGRVPVGATPRAGRGRGLLRRPVVAGVAAAVVLAVGGTAAANDWVQIFRTEKIAPVRVGTADLNALPDLRAYGEVVVTGDPDVYRAPDAAAAAAETGLDVPEVTTVPRGVGGEPTYHVGGEASITFTFSARRAARAAAEARKPLPPPPPGLDGSRVRLVAGPGVALIWSKSSGTPDLVVGRAIAPRALSSSGVPFETLRDYLLSLPGLPEDVAAPLRRFGADGSTLPLPVPADRVTARATRVDGEPATLLVSRDRSMAAVTWAKDGVVTVVAGPLDADEVLSVARGLR